MLTLSHKIFQNHINNKLQAVKKCSIIPMLKNVTNLIDFHGNWPTDEQKNFIHHMRIIPNFITENEENQLIAEIEPYMKRLRYEFDHWDDAIHGFRETERQKWYPHNRAVIDRIRTTAFDGEIMSYVHVLDLAEDGVIKPHVDSSRYCGTTISGISLLTNCVMRLVRIDDEKYKQTKSEEQQYNIKDNVAETSYRHQSEPIPGHNFYADILLPRRSLYIMCHSARYNFTHEILNNKISVFQGKSVRKTRRVSIICRNEP